MSGLVEATACLEFARQHLRDSDNMRKMIRWSDGTQLISLGTIPSTMTGEHQELLITCYYHGYCEA